MTVENTDIGKDGLVRVADKPNMSIPELVLEYPLELEEKTKFLTPEDELFVLAHLGVPKVDLSTWALEISGLVDKSLILSFDDLARYPKKTIRTAFQCAGNPMEPTVPTRTIGNVEWSGVLLRDILLEAGVKDSSTHLWAYGLDFGAFIGEEQEHYLKDLPLAYVMSADVLLATELNGKPLSEKHGFPARLIAPGFYGNNSVKWICKIELAVQRAQSLFTTRYYNDPDPETGKSKPVWAVEPESIIVSPATNDTLPKSPIEISGWAWSFAEVEKVEIKVDGGEWLQAELKPRDDLSWQKFSYSWVPEKAGTFKIYCCATDVEGKTQPLDLARNAVHSIEVNVEESEISE